MKHRVTAFRIALIKPAKCLVVGRTIKATDRAWREAIFGLGGSKKRIGGIRLGNVSGQPLALLAELQTEIAAGPPWTIESEHGLYALVGPAAVYNDAGYGPASIGISIDQLKAMVDFSPDAAAMEEGLRHTLELRKESK